MDDKKISMLSREFENIKSSVSQLIKELRSVKEIKVGLKQVRDDYSKRMSKIESEIKKLSRSSSPKDLIMLKEDLKAVKSISRKSNPREVEKTIKNEFGEINKKTNKFKKNINDSIEKMSDSVGATKLKMANLIPKIYSLEKEIIDMSSKNNKLFKKINARLLELEKNINVVEKSDTKQIEDIAKDYEKKLSEIQEKQKSLQNEINKIFGEMERINIKTNNTSKILNDLEKVL